MPTYSIQAPNGLTYKINGPAGATDDQVRAQVLQQHPDAETVQTVPTRRVAAVPVQTRQQGIESAARTAVNQSRQDGTPDALRAGAAGLRAWAPFDIPDRLAALGERFLPSAITGNTTNASYQDILDAVHAKTAAERGLSTTGNVLGSVAGALTGGKLLAGAAQGIAGRAAAAASPTVARVGNVLQRLTTLRRGQTGVNALKLATGGAAYAGTDEALNTDATAGKIAESAAVGAVAAPLTVAALHGGRAVVKGLVNALVRPAADFLGTNSASAILRKYTSMTAEDMATAVARKQAEGVSNPTAFELLPAQDREHLRDAIGLMPTNVRHQVADLVQERAAQTGPELSARASGIVAPDQGQRVGEMAGRLAESRGGTGAAPTPDELALSGNAADNPTAMRDYIATRSGNIMAPHNDTPVADNLNGILPTHPELQRDGSVHEVISDPQVAQVIQSAAGPARRLANGTTGGLTVSDLTTMASNIRDDANIPPGVRQRALDHLHQVISEASPEAGAAVENMVAAHAFDSRLGEAMHEGYQTRTQRDVRNVSGLNAQHSRQSYGTPEGAAGRALGQASRLTTDLSGAPDEVLSAANRIADNPAAQHAISENLGRNAGEDIAAAARSQSESMRALSSVKAPVKNETEDADPASLLRALSSLAPGSLPHSKIWALGRMGQIFRYLPERQTSQLVDAIFSGHPTRIAQAMRFMHNAGSDGAAALKMLSRGVIGGEIASGLTATNAPTDTQEKPQAPEASPTPEASTPETGTSGSNPNVPFGRSVISSLFPNAHITDDVRDPGSKLGKENPGSYHVKTQNAVDVKPIPGLTFKDYIDKIHAAGYSVVEAIDEVNHPSRFATGPHWHVVIAG